MKQETENNKKILQFAERLHKIQQSMKKHLEIKPVTCSDKKSDCVKRLCANILGSKGEVSRPLLETIDLWRGYLIEVQKPYLIHNGDDKEYEKRYNEFLTLPNIPQKVKECYILENKIDDFLNDIIEYERSIIT